MGVIDDNKAYLKRKHEGGLSSKKGSTFEDFYATYRIVALMSRFGHNLKHVSFTAQVEDAFVDDLLIAYPKKRFYHQIKDVNNLSWTLGNKTHTMQEDFELQKQACEEKHAAYELRLVCSHDSVQIRDIPDSLKSCTKLVHFESAKTLNACILSNKDFRDALSAISLEKSWDSLSNLGTCILGYWSSGNQQNVKLDAVYKHILSVSKGMIVLLGYPVEKLSDRCQAILSQIGIEYSQTGNLFVWSALPFKGSIAWSRDIDDKICKQAPKTIMDFLSIIN